MPSGRPDENVVRARGASPRESPRRPDGLPARWQAALKEGSRLESPEDILLQSGSTLCRLLRASESEVSKIVRSVSRSILEPGPETASRLKARLRYLSTGDEELDMFLGGGIPAAGVTEIYGESGTGKTQFCLQLCLTVQRPLDQGGLDGGAVFLETSTPFPVRRFEEMSSVFATSECSSLPATAGGSPGSKVFIAHLADLETQEHIIQYQLPVLMSNNNVKLIILDSAAANFRSMQEHGDGRGAFGGRRYYVDRARDICLLAQRLNMLGARHGAAVVCVNEVAAALDAEDADAEKPDDSNARKRRRPPDAGFGDEMLKPALGMAWSNMVMTRLQLLRRERFGIPHLEGSECSKVQETADRPGESERASSSATARSTTERQLRVVRCPYLPPKSCAISIGPSGLKCV